MLTQAVPCCSVEHHPHVTHQGVSCFYMSFPCHYTSSIPFHAMPHSLTIAPCGIRQSQDIPVGQALSLDPSPCPPTMLGADGTDVFHAIG